MNVLTEEMLRAEQLDPGTERYRVPEGTFVTRAAEDYLRERGIILERGAADGTAGNGALNSAVPGSGTDAPHAWKSMTRKAFAAGGKARYIDLETGEALSEKPEDMTHLRENLLVPKTHRRIRFRGSLDGLQARILLLAKQAGEDGEPGLKEDLKEILRLVRNVLGAEVLDRPLPEHTMLGLTEEGLHRMSHNVKKTFGIDHPIPSEDMSFPALRLNELRTQVREAELSAADAFEEEGDPLKIIREMNRLSSAVYILFLRELTGYYREKHSTL